MTDLYKTVQTILIDCKSRHDFWATLIRTHQLHSIAEIGAYKGEFAEILLRNDQGINNYLMIDPWKHLEGWNKPANKDDDTFESFYLEAKERTHFARDRISIHRETSAVASRKLPNGGIDLAYIDGDHTLRGITVDLNCIYEKVSPNGLIGGDDFCPSIWQHDAQYEPTFVFPYAVHFAEAKGDHIYALPFNQFLIHKQGLDDFNFFNLTSQYNSTSILGQVMLIKNDTRSVSARAIEKLKRGLKSYLLKG
jgi:hypothetical protein